MAETPLSATCDPSPTPAGVELAPPDYYDPVLEAYKKDVDRTLLRENLKLTVEERIRKAQDFHRSLEGWREAGRRSRSAQAEGKRP
jgi:hypothetical protein